jgi:hypothetical protein
MLNKMPSKQVLLMLDVCHAGTFDDRIIGANTKGPAGLDHLNMNVKEFLKDKGQHTTRWGLTSVGNEFAFDGNAWLGHSPFANLLLQVLEAKGQGTNGIVTLSDIYAVLQSASNNSDQRLKISPHRVGFGDNNPLSEFILIPEYKEQTIAGSEKKPKQ